MAGKIALFDVLSEFTSLGLPQNSVTLILSTDSDADVVQVSWPPRQIARLTARIVWSGGPAGSNEDRVALLQSKQRFLFFHHRGRRG